MNFLKSESYSLSPDEYLEKFKNPHQIISTKGDAEMDEKDLIILNDILSKYYNDSHESTNIKERIVNELSAIVDQWMNDMANTTKHPNFDFQELGYGLKVFGSYRLKTNSYDGDIDMLCIVPEFINRERHFFVILANYFRKHEHLKEIFSIRT